MTAPLVPQSSVKWGSALLIFGIVVCWWVFTITTRNSSDISYLPPVVCSVVTKPFNISHDYINRSVRELFKQAVEPRLIKPAHLLFIGDSQTRYLFVHFIRFLLEHVEEWCRIPSHCENIPPAPSLDTKFAFSWVVKSWPPYWFLRNVSHRNSTTNTSVFPYVVSYICVEYASTQQWLVNYVHKYQPSHVVIGRGCWDMLRRLPSDHRLTMLITELRQLLQHIVNMPSVVGVAVFPHLRIAPIKGQPLERQKHDSPWTWCMTQAYQDVFWQASVWAAASVDTFGKTMSLLEANDYTLDVINQPNDGLHYDSEPVVQQLNQQLLDLLVLSQNRTLATTVTCMSGDISTIAGAMDSRLNKRLHEDAECNAAQQAYYTSIQRYVIPAALKRQNESATSHKYTACNDFRYTLWRYLGPEPWECLDDDGARCAVAVAREKCLEPTPTDRQRLLQAVRRQQDDGDGLVCKVPVMSLLEHFIVENDYINPLDDSWLAVNCINEAFGGRP